MSLNIKNEEVHDLVRKAAKITGKSQTSVVEEALRRFLIDLEREDRRRRADQTLAEMRKIIRELGPPPITIEDLYDPETGLPA